VPFCRGVSAPNRGATASMASGCISPEERHSHLAVRIVGVEVDEHDRLPRAERQAPAEDRDDERRRHQRGQEVVRRRGRSPRGGGGNGRLGNEPLEGVKEVGLRAEPTSIRPDRRCVGGKTEQSPSPRPAQKSPTDVVRSTMRDLLVSTSRTTESISAPSHPAPAVEPRSSARPVAPRPPGRRPVPHPRRGPRHDRAHRAVDEREEGAALTRRRGTLLARTRPKAPLAAAVVAEAPGARTTVTTCSSLASPEPTGSVAASQKSRHPSHSSPRKRSSVHRPGVSTVTVTGSPTGVVPPKSAGVGRAARDRWVWRRRSRATEAAARRSRGARPLSDGTASSEVSGAALSTSTPRPCPHQRHATSSVRSLSTTSSSTTRSPPTVKCWNWRVVRVEVTSKRVRLRMRAAVAGRAHRPTVLGDRGAHLKAGSTTLPFSSRTHWRSRSRRRRSSRAISCSAMPLPVAVAPAACWEAHAGASPSPGGHSRYPLLIVGRSA